MMSLRVHSRLLLGSSSPLLLRTAGPARGLLRTHVSAFSYSTDRYPTDNPNPSNTPGPSPAKDATTAHGTDNVPTSSVGSQDQALQESQEAAEAQRQMQAPNRASIWSRSQQPRDKAMVGPRFEQTVMEYQPQPYAAIDLIHKQPVRWTHEHIVACDGGGGPLGHPKIFINVDKPQICWCTYCGLPYAHEHHRKLLEAQPSTTYPLGPKGDAAEVSESQQITDEPLAQR